MSNVKNLDSSDRLVFWSIVVMSLVPLVPYALAGAGS
jgi:hypothetical protein